MTTRAGPASLPISGSTALGGARVEVRQRLVEQQQLGLVQRGAADRHPLGHAARQRPHRLVGPRAQPDLVEQRLHPRLGHAVQPRVEAQVLARGELAVEQRVVREQADPPAHRPAVGGQRRAPAPARGRRAGCSSVARIRSSVVLPAPLAPNTASVRPGSSVSVTPASAVRSP